MKRFLLFFSLIALGCCGSCSSKPATVNPEPVIGSSPKLKAHDANLKDWLGYYRQKGLNPDPSQFELTDTASLPAFMPGNVHATFDPEFDSVYLHFLVYSPDRTRYIDFDSYQWTIGPDGKPGFSPDQETDLVDLKRRTVRRLAFRGPSQWVENVSWKNNSTVYLLESSDEGQLFISEIDLKTGKVHTYQYKRRVPFRSEYAKKRLEWKLNRLSSIEKLIRHGRQFAEVTRSVQIR
jgi:hypothetical protein